jgi:hypothetical protein
MGYDYGFMAQKTMNENYNSLMAKILGSTGCVGDFLYFISCCGCVFVCLCVLLNCPCSKQLELDGACVCVCVCVCLSSLLVKLINYLIFIIIVYHHRLIIINPNRSPQV